MLVDYVLVDYVLVSDGFYNGRPRLSFIAPSALTTKGIGHLPRFTPAYHNIAVLRPGNTHKSLLNRASGQFIVFNPQWATGFHS